MPPETLTGAPEAPPAARLHPRVVAVLAVACGLSVGNLYYIQPILPDIAAGLGAPASAVGGVATLGQVGYGLGLLLLVPLGDTRSRRQLILRALCAVIVGLVAVAAAPGLPWLAVAMLALGVVNVVPQMIVPFAAALAGPAERGRVVGTVMSGLLIGILLARTVSGFVTANFGWRAVYWMAAALMVALTVTLWRLLPRDAPGPGLPYPALLRSLWGLLRAEPALREAAWLGALSFGAFNVFWITLALFLAGPPYHYGSAAVGLFGLVGVAGALGASLAGRLADRIDARLTTGAALALMLVAFALFGLAGKELWGLLAGVVVLDLGAQVTHISNQTRIYSLHAAARNRYNTVYMVAYFIGGAGGSALGLWGWTQAGWPGVCGIGLALAAVALAVYARARLRRGPAPP
jgi:predicted MFS family arabinose efflux permease